jgi:putative cell wall-binding protein
VLAAALCLTATATVPAYADDEPLLPVPPLAESPATTSSDTPPELLAVPREGSPASYLADAPEPLPSGAPARSGGTRSLSVAETGSISGTITGLVGASDVPLPGAIVYAMQWSDYYQDYMAVAGRIADAGGHYVIPDLAPGEYFILVEDGSAELPLLPEFYEDAPIIGWATPLTVAVGADIPDVNERLEPLFKDYIAGADRYETSVEISKAGFDTGVPCVYVASGENFPDALSAGPAAAKCGGPLLLVRPSEVPSIVLEEIAYLQPGEIVIAGGPNAIAPAVETALQTIAPVRRIYGADRYETSRKIVADAFDGAKAVWLATGSNFPDALAASGAASAAYLPVLIVPGNAPGIDSPSLDTIAALAPNVVAIAGGSAVVSPGIVNQLSASGFGVAQFAGVDRYDTSLQINQAVWEPSAGAWSVYAFMANGEKFPDALSGAPLAGGLFGTPLYVVPPVCTPAGVQSHTAALGVHEVYLLGYFSKLDFDGKPFLTC